jgi:RNA polymerase sigma-B factor
MDARRTPQHAAERLGRRRWTDARLRELPDLSGRRRRAAEDAIVLGNLDVVAGIARRVAPGYREQEDLRQVGCIGLVLAVRRFDPHVGDSFLAFAVPTVAGEIKRYLRDTGWVIRPPRGVQELSGRLDGAQSELAQMLGRTPTTAEVARHLHSSAPRVGEAARARENLRPGSLDAPVNSSVDAESVADTLGVIDEALERAELRITLRAAMSDLTPRERLIIDLRFVQQCTQTEIAARIGVTQMQVSRLLAGILGRLRARLGQPQGTGASAARVAASPAAARRHRPAADARIAAPLAA